MRRLLPPAVRGAKARGAQGLPGCKKKRNCDGIVVSLNSKQMPKSPAEVNSFLCESCRFIACVVQSPDGRMCGNVAPKKSRASLRAKKSHARVAIARRRRGARSRSPLPYRENNKPCVAVSMA